MIKGNNFITLFRFIICAIFIFGYFFNLSNAQSDYYKISNLTTYDGLPSNEVFTTFQDKDGFIWVGTKLGVSKFDGYTFQNFGISEGLKDLTISHITQDEEGIIWVGSVWGNLYKLINNNFVAYEFQECIDDYKLKFTYISGFEVINKDCNKNPEILLGLFNVGFLKIDEYGFSKLYQSDWSPSLVYYASPKLNIIIKQTYIKDSIVNFNISKLNTKVYSFDGQKLTFINNIICNNLHTTYFVKNDSDFIIGFKDRLAKVMLPSGSVLENKKFPFITSMVKIKKDQYLVSSYLMNSIYKLVCFSNIIAGQKEIIINDNIRGIYKDRQGLLWVSSYASGLYCVSQNKALYKLDKLYNNYSGHYHRRIEIDTESQNLYTNDAHSNIIEYNLGRNEASIYELKVGLLNNFKISNKGLLVATSNGGIRIENKKIYTVKDKYFTDYYLNGFCVINSIDSILAYNATSAFILKSDTLFSIYKSISPSISNRVIAICRSQSSNYFVAKLSGLYLSEKNMLFKYTKLDTLLKSSISFLFNEGESGIWVGTNSDGIYIEYNEIIYHLTEQDGLLSNQITKIISDYRGNYYILSNKGIDLVYFKNGMWQINNLNYLNDLTTESISDIAAYDSILLIATFNNIYMAQKVKIAENTWTPFLVEFKGANGKVINLPYHLNSTNNDLIINWCSLDLKRLGKIKYRYKIRNENSWIETYDREILLMSLKPMKYNLQVQAQNSNGQWSQSLIIPFEVLKPWWNSIYFILFCIILFIFLVWLFVTSKIENIQKETNIRNTIFKLTNQALISQINPHFIFNCLNSIKLLIRQQENIQADNYLGYFSKLLRKTLNASKKENWTIEEEMDLLENYVKMENMRLKNKIHLNCKIDTQIEKQQYLIPSLICQTLVENSIKHGFSDNDGVINIDINIDKMDKDTLKFEIVDDGIGFKKLKISNKNKGDDGIQLGLNLTRQRLQLFNENADKENLVVESPSDIILDRGTKISLLVKIRT